jgi:hypothetical protein
VAQPPRVELEEGARELAATVTSSKWRLSIWRRSSGSKRYTWYGFSKSAGAFGVMKKAAPSSLSTRADSATCPSGWWKCSIRCDEHTQSTPPVRTAICDPSLAAVRRSLRDWWAAMAVVGS